MQENLIIIAIIFFTRYIQKKTFGNQLYQKKNIFNFFPASIPLNNVRRILESVCVRRTNKDVPWSALWISCLFIELANKNEKVCLKLDCSENILNRPRKFRNEADNPDSQACYFNVINNEQLFNIYISEWINNLRITTIISLKLFI